MNTFADLFNVVNPYLVVLYGLLFGLMCGWYVKSISTFEKSKGLLKASFTDLNLKKGSRDEYWLLAIIIGISAITIATSGSFVEYIASLTGVIGAYLVAQGKSSSYVWGFVATALYTWVSYKYKFYGETITYAWIFLPMQIIGLYYWMKNSNNGGADTIKRYLSTKQNIWLGVVTVVAIALYGLFLRELKGEMPGLDAVVSILSIVATTLMVLRISTQWTYWILVNVTAIAMWVQAVIKHENQGYAVLAMWILFLLNSLFGRYKWRKGEMDGEEKRVSST